MTLWRTDVGDDIYRLNTLNDNVIKEAEELLNVELPEAYINLLKEQNGGYIEYNSIPCPSNQKLEDNTIDIDYIMGIGKDTGILDSSELIQEWELPENIVLFSGDGHSWFAFDYRIHKKNPPIILIDTESNIILSIATSFKQFLNQLYTEESVEFDPDGTVQVSKGSLLIAIEENNISDIIQSIDLLPFEIDFSIEWFSELLIKLSNHSNNEVRKSVSQATYSLMNELDTEKLSILATKFENDIDLDVKYYGTLVNEKLI
ncbi:SMI1/KNR4 family protein [Solibacillus isronensis]|uniref:SMI1/KNR4 family protein n=1 Tax=Solibacillus isronensis TaxID=412383 RepID=UPI0009A645EB|nr:SMI1/KNR4 family protein [Solibacillus isronensis]